MNTLLRRFPGWAFAVRTEQGRVRRRMEDAWAIEPSVPFTGRLVHAVGVFDGLGGEPRGDVAATAAADALKQAVEKATNASDVLRRLNEVVLPTGGATTAVVALADAAPESGLVEIVSVGDSAAFRLEHDRLTLVTPKDSGGGSIVEDFLGNPVLRGHRAAVNLGVHGSMVLCTDGIDGVVDPALLVALLRAPPDALVAAVDQAFAAMENAGAPDNGTLIALRRD